MKNFRTAFFVAALISCGVAKPVAQWCFGKAEQFYAYVAGQEQPKIQKYACDEKDADERNKTRKVRLGQVDSRLDEIEVTQDEIDAVAEQLKNTQDADKRKELQKDLKDLKTAFAEKQQLEAEKDILAHSHYVPAVGTVAVVGLYAQDAYAWLKDNPKTVVAFVAVAAAAGIVGYAIGAAQAEEDLE